MAEFVIDTSALLAVLLDEPERPALIAVTGGVRLAVPPSVPWEVGNALSAMVKRQRISADQAKKLVESFETIPLRSVKIDLGKAVQLASELGLYAYDAYLLEAARAGRCGLLTLDRTMKRAAEKAGISTVEIQR